MQRTALLTLLAFGCATVRVPVAQPAEPQDAPGAIAPPITELWIESSEPVPAEAAAKADADARVALAQALAGRQLPAHAAGAADPVLFVRERAVATTEARQRQQTWAKVAIVLSIVLVVAVVIIVAASGKGSSVSPAKGTHAAAPVKAGVPVAVRPQVPHIAHVVPAPAPYYRPVSPIWFGLYLDFWIPPRPLVLESQDAEPWFAADAPPPIVLDAPPPPDESAPPPDESAPPYAEPPPEPVPEVSLQLPALADEVNFRVEDRGFFDGPRTAIQLDLLDRTTGRILWTKAVNAEADPLDPAAVAKVVDEAFAGARF